LFKEKKVVIFYISFGEQERVPLVFTFSGKEKRKEIINQKYYI
jgi:hypothetical protein